MLTASDKFKTALSASHQALTRVVLLAPTAGGGFSDTEELTVVSGTLSIDGTRNVWRTADLQLAPQSTVERSSLESIDSTYRIRIERGIKFSDNTEEWVNLGILQVQEITLGNRLAGASITASDLGALIEDYNLVTPYVPQSLAGTALTTVQAIQDLVASAIAWGSAPTWAIDASISTTAVPATGTVFSGSRWAAIQTLAESLGAVVYASPSGQWKIKSATINTSTPDFEIFAGDGGTLVEYSIVKSRSQQYNAIPLRWETPTAGGLVFVVDSDTSSPTYWNGPFGRRPREETTNDTITSAAQATTAATALLNQYKGRASALSFSSVHNPLMEPLDVVQIRSGDMTQTHVIDSISYPLAGGVMSCQTRLVQQS